MIITKLNGYSRRIYNYTFIVLCIIKISGFAGALVLIAIKIFYIS